MRHNLSLRRRNHAVEWLESRQLLSLDASGWTILQPSGDSRVIYLDPDQFLEIRVVDHRVVRGQEQVQTTDVGEYEKVDGVYFPFEQGQNHVESAELNKPVDAAMFSFPTAKR